MKSSLRELNLHKPSDQIQLMVWLNFTGLYQGFQCKRLITIFFFTGEATGQSFAGLLTAADVTHGGKRALGTHTQHTAGRAPTLKHRIAKNPILRRQQKKTSVWLPQFLVLVYIQQKNFRLCLNLPRLFLKQGMNAIQPSDTATKLLNVNNYSVSTTSVTQTGLLSEKSPTTNQSKMISRSREGEHTQSFQLQHS